MNLIKTYQKRLSNAITTFLKKINYVFLFISLLHFSLTFFTDDIMINFYNMGNYIFCKIILLIILILFWQTIAKIYVKKDKELIKYAKYFLIYIIPIGILLALVYPGVWYADDLTNLLDCVNSVSYLYHLSYLTSIFYSIGCMLFPYPSGAVILLVFCFGIIVSYVVKRTFDVTKGKKISYLMYLPFFLLNTLFYTYHANRPIIVTVFYLLLISILLFDKIENKRLTSGKLIVISLLTGLLATWRKENLYLVVSIPIFIFLSYKLKFNVKNLMKVVLPIFIFSFVVYMPQHFNYNTPLKRANRNLYNYINPLSWMVNQELEGEKIEEAFEKIEKVVSIDSLKKHSSYADTPIFWEEPEAIKFFSLEEYKKFKEGFYYIVKNNFGLFIETKWRTFLLSSGIINDSYTSKNLYRSENDRIQNYESSKTIFGYKVRQNVLTILEGRSVNEYISNFIYRLIFNLFVPLIFLCIIIIYSIIKKNLYLFLMSGMLLGHVFLVFITSPAGYFMYYFNVYLCGWFLFMLFIILKSKRNLNEAL